MSAERLADPAVEPVSVAEFRDWLRSDDGGEDAILANLVTTARLALEGHTRRAFVSQGWRFTYLSCGPDGLLRLPLGPLLSVDAIAVYDGAGVATSPPPYEAIADAERPAVRLRGAVGFARLALDVTLGYGETPDRVPAPLRQAILMLATNWHARRGDHPETGLTIPRAVTALVAPYRRARLA